MLSFRVLRWGVLKLRVLRFRVLKLGMLSAQQEANCCPDPT